MLNENHTIIQTIVEIPEKVFKEFDILLRKRLHDLNLASYVRQNKEALHKCLRLKNKYENIHREGNYFKAGIAAAVFIFIISFFVFQYSGITGFVIGPEGDIIEEEHYAFRYKDPTEYVHTIDYIKKTAKLFGLQVRSLGEIADYGYPKKLATHTNILIEITPS